MPSPPARTTRPHCSTTPPNAWGWRIPFLIGGALGIYALVMRARMKETGAFVAETPNEKHEAMWPQILRYRMQALQVIGLTVGLTVSYYIWGVVAPCYAATTLKMDRGDALWAGVIANIVFIAALAFWGRLSDRIGRKPVLIMSSAGAALLFSR